MGSQREKIHNYILILKNTDLFLAVLKVAKTNINVLVTSDEDLLIVQCHELHVMREKTCECVNESLL